MISSCYGFSFTPTENIKAIYISAYAPQLPLSADFAGGVISIEFKGKLGRIFNGAGIRLHPGHGMPHGRKTGPAAGIDTEYDLGSDNIDYSTHEVFAPVVWSCSISRVSYAYSQYAGNSTEPWLVGRGQYLHVGEVVDKASSLFKYVPANCRYGKP
jgi:hypothetical protein